MALAEALGLLGPRGSELHLTKPHGGVITGRRALGSFLPDLHVDEGELQEEGLL